MKKKLAPFFENFAEAGAACLITMAQGNILLFGLSHWLTATQTGFIAGLFATTALTMAKTSNRLAIAGILGVTTAIVDYFVHPGMLGDHAATEAIVTGIGAAALSYLAGTVIHYWQKRRQP